MRLIIIVVLLYTTFKVVSCCYNYSIAVEQERVDHRQPLPVKCAVYYNDGTDRWKDCMGVGYVREEDSEHD